MVIDRSHFFGSELELYRATIGRKIERPWLQQGYPTKSWHRRPNANA
jgi:hypothetical protein